MTVAELTRFRTDALPSIPPVVVRQVDRYGTILAFDQALAKVGWCLMRVTGQERVVLKTGMCKTEPTDYKGYEDTLRRSTFLAQQLRPLMKGETTGFVPDVVAHEMPVMMGSKVPSKNREGGIVAATAVRITADERFLPCVMLNRQHIYHVLGLGLRSSKAEVANAVRAIFPDLKVRSVGPLNEDTHDAIALAIAVAEGDWL